MSSEYYLDVKKGLLLFYQMGQKQNPQPFLFSCYKQEKARGFVNIFEAFYNVLCPPNATLL